MVFSLNSMYEILARQTSAQVLIYNEIYTFSSIFYVQNDLVISNRQIKDIN